MMIYVAGPYTHPDPVANTRKAAEAFDMLVSLGHTPVVPHVNMLLHLITPRPDEFWYAYDLELLERCDAIVRLPGESPGADREVEYAKAHGVPLVSLHYLAGQPA